MSDDLVPRLRRAVTWQGVVPHGNELAREAADEIERLRAYTDACNTLLAERVEIECLRGLAIRAWHSFRSGGLTHRDRMPHCLSDGDMAELKRLADADAAKKLERDVLRDCRQGNQRCHECPDTECADNMAAEGQLQIPKMPNEREDEPIE